MRKKSEKIRALLWCQFYKLFTGYLCFVRFSTYWYLKSRFVSNTFGTIKQKQPLYTTHKGTSWMEWEYFDNQSKILSFHSTFKKNVLEVAWSRNACSLWIHLLKTFYFRLESWETVILHIFELGTKVKIPSEIKPSLLNNDKKMTKQI